MTSLAPRESDSIALDHFEHGLNRVVVSKDGSLIATSDVDMNVVVSNGANVVYSANFGSSNDKIRPTERIRGLAFSPDGLQLYVAAGDQVVALNTDRWDTEWTYTAPRSFGFLIISPVALDVADNGDVACAFDNGTIVVWNAAGARTSVVRDNDSPRWLRFVDDGERIVGSDSFSICGWHPEKRKRKQKIALRDRVFGMDVDRTGAVVAGRTLHEIVLWNLDEGVIVNAIPVNPSMPVFAFHPQEKLIAYGERNVVKIVDFQGNPVEQFELQVSSVLSMAFTPAGDELLVGCTEQKLIRRRLMLRDVA